MSELATVQRSKISKSRADLFKQPRSSKKTSSSMKTGSNDVAFKNSQDVAGGCKTMEEPVSPSANASNFVKGVEFQDPFGNNCVLYDCHLPYQPNPSVQDNEADDNFIPLFTPGVDAMLDGRIVKFIPCESIEDFKKFLDGNY